MFKDINVVINKIVIKFLCLLINEFNVFIFMRIGCSF